MDQTATIDDFDLLAPGLEDIRMDLLDQSRDIEALLDQAVTVYNVLVAQEAEARKVWENAKHVLDLRREQLLLAEYDKGKDGAINGRNAEIRAKQETAFLAELPTVHEEYAGLLEQEGIEATKLEEIQQELAEAEIKLSGIKYVCRLHTARMEMMKPA